MTVTDLNTTQWLLLKARATNFASYRPSKDLPAEHGVLSDDIDQCLAFGILKHGYDEDLPGDLSASVFVPFNKCLHYCMQNGIVSKNLCEVCDSIADLSKHSSQCMSHPEVCGTCKSFFNILEYHLKNCYTCDMHLCTKLKLKMMKYNIEVTEGLTDLWSKIQQYVSRLLPAVLVMADRLMAHKNGFKIPGRKQVGRFPSIFDSVSLTPPPSPVVVARAPGKKEERAGQNNEIDHYHGRIQLMADPGEMEQHLDYLSMQGHAAMHDSSSTALANYEEYMSDMNKITKEFQRMVGGSYPGYSDYCYGLPGTSGASSAHPGASPAHPGASPGHPGFSVGSSQQYFTGVTVPSLTGGMDDDMMMSTEMYSIDSHLKFKDGCGCVINGEPRQLRALAQHWDKLKQRLEGSNGKNNMVYKTQVDGVILKGTNSDMAAIDDEYTKNVHWSKIIHIGSGVAGKCFLAADVQTQAQFAVKRIELRNYQPEELEYWAELEHPNLVKLYGAIRVKHKIYIFSEFYAAGTVAEFIEESRMLDQWMSVFFLQQLLDALTYLKKKNVLHEDIKADNIFLKLDSYTLGLGDFGLCRKGRCPPGQKPVGGQHHWSPEKAKSEGHSYPADVWAANCTFIHMLSGDPPWRRRYPDLPFLHFAIAESSPPVDDIPASLITMVDSLIRRVWTCDPNERPTAEDLLNDDCFQILDYDHLMPEFRSHIPDVVEDEGENEMDMDMEGVMESDYSLSSILEGVEDKQIAIEYIQNLCASIGQEEIESGVISATAGGAVGGAAAPLSSPNAASMRRQFSMRAPQMASIVEENDISLDRGDFDMDIPSEEPPKERPSLALIIPKPLDGPTLDRRQSWGQNRSSTSPSPNITEEAAAFPHRHDQMKRRDTSPAIVLSSNPLTEAPELLGEKDIFSLNPGPVTSGYGTGSSTYPHYPSNDDSLSLKFSSNEPPSSHQGFDPISGTWQHQDSSAPLYPYMGADPLSAASSSPYDPMNVALRDNSHYHMTENRMEPIALKPDNNPDRSSDPLEDFDYSSSMINLKASLSSANGGPMECKSILTIVNGETHLEDIDVLVRGNETWRDIVEHNFDKVELWSINPYTYYLESGEEVALDQTVPKSKTNVFIFPTTEDSSWQVCNSHIEHTKMRIQC